jgi:hypothetical protein
MELRVRAEVPTRLAPAWLQDVQPADAFWYYTDARGQAWTARRWEDRLAVVGTATGWEPRTIERADADALVRPTGPRSFRFQDIEVDRPVALWLLAVSAAAFPPASADAVEEQSALPPSA